MKRFAGSALTVVTYYGILWFFDLDGPSFLLGILFLCLAWLQISLIKQRAPLTAFRYIICLLLLPVGLLLIGISLIVATGTAGEAVVLNRSGKIVNRIPASSIGFKRPAQSYTYVPTELLKSQNYEIEGVASLTNGSTVFYRLNTRTALDPLQIERILAPERSSLSPWSFVRSFHRTILAAIERSSIGSSSDPTYIEEPLRIMLSIELQEALKGYIGAADIEILELVIIPRSEEMAPDQELRRA